MVVIGLDVFRIICCKSRVVLNNFDCIRLRVIREALDPVTHAESVRLMNVVIAKRLCPPGQRVRTGGWCYSTSSRDERTSIPFYHALNQKKKTAKTRKKQEGSWWSAAS